MTGGTPQTVVPAAADAAARRRILDDAELARELIAKFAKPDPPERFFDPKQWSAAIIAVITVLATSVLSYKTQQSLREQEVAAAQTTAFAERRRAVGDSASNALAAMLKATGDWLDVARGRYDALDSTQLRTLVDESNAIDRRWRAERNLWGYRLRLFFAGTEVPATWTRARETTDALHDCAERAYLAHQGTTAPDSTCAALATRAGRLADSLTTLVVARELDDVPTLVRAPRTPSR